jgi:hypothetical protein
MARRTTLTHRLMWKNKRPSLRGVALEAGFVLAQERNAAPFERLLNVCLSTFDSNPHVRIMTISAADFAFEDGMMMRQLELCTHFQVTLETSFR